VADLNLQLALDTLSTKVEAVVPRVMEAFRFERYRGATPLEEAENPLRSFEWRDTGDFGVTGAGGGESGPQFDGASLWLYADLELAVAYPDVLQVPDDSTARGINGLALADSVDLVKAIMFADPLAALNFGYYHLQLRRRSRGRRVRSLWFRLKWQEDYP
jgi:hypothetical protein